MNPEIKPIWSTLSGVQANVRRNERGQSVVEFALILPVLMLIIFGIFKFGVVYNNDIQLTNAVDSGARLFALERGQGDPCQAVVQNLDSAAAGLNATSGGLTVTFTTVPATTTDTWVNGVEQNSGTCPTLTSGNSEQVAASYPCDLSIFGVNFYSGCTISARSTETIQ